MKDISQEEAKRHLLYLLDCFHSLCEEHQLTYYLDSGTMLGAIRHKGFIPWDDDIDVAMPREDYDRLFREYDTWEHPEYLKVYDYRRNKDYHFPFMKFSDDRTLMLFSRHIKQELGLHLDIFPIDGIPQNKILSFFHIHLVHFLQRCQSLAHRGKWRLKKYSFAEKVARFVFRVLTLGAQPQFFCMLQEKCSTRYLPSVSPYRANITWCSAFTRPARYRIPSEAYVSTIDVPFEGKFYKAPIGYDTYLSMAYGDYMTPPPPEKRTNVHYFEAWWKDGVDPHD